MLKPADNEHEIHELLKQRWSPLAFADVPVDQDTLRRLFEAARWSPSSFNEQPWRFIVGTKDYDPETYQKLLGILMPGNQAWAGTAPVLILGTYKQRFSHNDSPNGAALYDLGQAVAHLTFQAVDLGLYIHQMGGYDREKARAEFGVPEEYGFGAVIALGYIGGPEVLADEKQREKHLSPARSRRRLSEIVLTGTSDQFGKPSPLV